MRKRIVIGVLAIIGVGILVYGVRQSTNPKKGTLEWHIKEFTAAERELSAETWADRAGMIWNRLRGNDYIPPHIDMSDPNNPMTRSERHERALIDLGYLEKREFYLTNKSRGQIEKNLESFAATLPKPDTQIWYIHMEPNRIIIRSQKTDMPKWEELLRNVDVP